MDLFSLKIGNCRRIVAVPRIFDWRLSFWDIPKKSAKNRGSCRCYGLNLSVCGSLFIEDRQSVGALSLLLGFLIGGLVFGIFQKNRPKIGDLANVIG